jgi:hypothetical protein
VLRRFAASLLCAGIVLGAARARAEGRSLEPFSTQGRPITIDGLLREWPSGMTHFDYTLRGRARGGDPRASAEIAYDDANLYVAFKVFDRRIVRTPAAGPDEDHATLRIAFPRGAGFVTREVLIYPGKPGRVAGVAKLAGGGAVPGSRVVEAPMKGGLTVEALIPWSTFPEASRVRVGLRGAIDYTDADAPGSVGAVIGTSPATSGGALPPLPLEDEQALVQSLLRPKRLSGPAHVAYGNVSGDAMIERVGVYGRYLTIVGPHYRGGKQFYYGDLGTDRVTRLELQDLDGDGRDEIVVRKRVGDPDKYREVLEVYKVGANDTPFVAFQHEVGIVTPEGRIENSVRFVPRGGRVGIEIAQGTAEGFDATTYHEPLSGDMPGALLPWQAIGSQSFAWNGSQFAKIGETTYVPRHAGAPRRRRAGPPPPPTPRPPTADELLGRVYALYRKERHVGRAHPSFDFVTDVAGDRRNERVLVHGKDIVVFGKGFRGGTSYAFITVGVKRPKDILDVTARDLTGDGKAEIIVRAVLRAKESKALGGKTVERDALFVYKVTDTGIHRIFAAETGRALGHDRIIGAALFEPAEQGLAIQLEPGRAVGWTQGDYPFPTDTTADGGLEPLPLPWGNASPRRYTFNGEEYVQK